MAAISLEAVYRDYHDKVCHFILRKTQDMSVAEDLTEEVFLKLMRKADTYDPAKAAVSTWVYTIANNTVTDWYRTRRVTEEIPNDSGEEGAVPSYLVDMSAPDSGLLCEEQLSALADALELLPQRERDLVILHYYSGLTLKDVADKMGMSYANVKIVHKKALDKLRLQLATFA